MISLTVDGIGVTVSEGSNLIEAARKAGVEIPVYCYHPGLSVVGQCRICFVEVEGMPRLVTACSTPAQDDMVVLTASERVQQARAAVMEFLLENHPLDCPVCDQAGECSLQDFSVAHGHDSTHMVDVRRTFPGLERRMIGPHVVQNQNRCIHCTRCVRFTTEISETSDLTMKSRGNHSYIDTYDGRPLDNPWSACVADVCPVGALTVKEFRFRARVWHLEEASSICPGCSIGCGIHLGHLDGVVHRFVPRENLEINGWWMCDYGRFLADGLNHREVQRPAIKHGDAMRPATWGEAVTRLASTIRRAPKPILVCSANHSNETLFEARRSLVEGARMTTVVPVHHGDTRRIKDGHGRWVISRDAHANSTGARLLGLPLADAATLESLLRDADGPIVILDAHAHPWLSSDAAAAALSGRPVAVAARTRTPLVDAADIVLPITSWAESEGTYTSSTGRVQLAERALSPAGLARAPWQVVVHLARELGVSREDIQSPRELFAAMASSVTGYSGMTWRRLQAGAALKIDGEVSDVG